MTLLDGLMAYLAVGALGIFINDWRVMKELDLEDCFLRARERILMAVRVMLAWPTYLLEDLFCWVENDED
jgi:Ran GTPase-activating protein (RanGAP) involved in mRNA processing and transport